jgi:hypothetical protein
MPKPPLPNPLNDARGMTLAPSHYRPNKAPVSARDIRISAELYPEQAEYTARLMIETS